MVLWLFWGFRGLVVYLVGCCIDVGWEREFGVLFFEGERVMFLWFIVGLVLLVRFVLFLFIVGKFIYWMFFWV